MQENNWQRLRRLVDGRCAQIGLTQQGIQERGGPSSGWVRALQKGEGPPRPRHARPLRGLDAALGWPEATAWNLLTIDRTGWSAEQLAAEEERLRHMPRGKSKDVDEPSNVREFPRSQAAEPDYDKDILETVCTDTVNRWLWYCDEHQTHGNADSREEAEAMAEAHVLFHDDLEGSDNRNPCPVFVWSVREGTIDRIVARF